MPAISRIASHLSNVKLGRYLSGLWENNLVRGLLFERITPANRRDVHGTQDCGPTWSWAVSDLPGSNAVSYDHILKYGFKQSPEFKIVDAKCSPIDGKNPFGWARGILTVRGLIVPAVF
jgi:hypothetical protein